MPGIHPLIRQCLFGALLTLPVALPLQADAETWTARVGRWSPADLEEPGPDPDTGIRRRELLLAWDGQLLKLPHRLSYGYRPVLLRAGNPAHNGYFHQLDVRAERTLFDTTLAITVGVHGSSNMFKHGDFHGDAVVATAAALHRRREQDIGVGFFGDYRFDRFRLYPRLHFSHDAGTGTFELDLPVAVRWQDNQDRWSAGIERFGEKWGALDASRNVESAFYLSEWRLGVTRRWQTGNGPGLALTAGVSFDTGVRYRDLVAGARDSDLDPAAFLMFEISMGR